MIWTNETPPLPGSEGGVSNELGDPTVSPGCDFCRIRHTKRVTSRTRENPMTPSPRLCTYGCGQDVMTVLLPSGVWMTFSTEPVPYRQINRDLPAIVWRKNGNHLDAHTAPVTPRLAYPIHLCPHRRDRDVLRPVGAGMTTVWSELVTSAATA
jgi:hypothetical protein